MKLIVEYSYPEASKLISVYESYPWVEKESIESLTLQFYREALKHIDRNGFRMSVRLVEQE